MTLRLLDWQPVVMIWTEHCGGERHIISMRKADAREEAIYWERSGEG